MSKRLTEQTVASEAEAVIRDLGIQSLPVDPFWIAKQKGIEVMAKLPRIGQRDMPFSAGTAFNLSIDEPPPRGGVPSQTGGSLLWRFGYGVRLSSFEVDKVVELLGVLSFVHAKLFGSKRGFGPLFHASDNWR
jgi:hypothetical protein